MIKQNLKVIISSSIANMFEWYDYALFGHLAYIIGDKFFPQSDKSTVLLQAFLVFAIGYLMRPIGGIFFGILGDKFGRKTALSTAVICMSIPTGIIAIIPTYESIGIASTFCMVFVRMMQGLSMGGALTGSISFVIEHTDQKHRGLFGSFSMSGICTGILLGSAVCYLIKLIMTDAQFNDWGWRLPFIIGIFILATGLYIRKYTNETPMFDELRNKGNIAKSPVKKILKEYWPDIIISIFINSTGSVIFYLQAIYLMSFLTITRGFDSGEVNNLTNLCYLLMAFITIFAGSLSDSIGRRKIYIINLCAIIVLSPFLLQILETADFVGVIIAQIIMSIMAATYIGPEPALQAEFYPTDVRNTALSMSYNTATSLFGGTTPYVVEFLYQKTGTIVSCQYYIIACCASSIIALFFYKNRSVSKLKSRKYINA
ncbi:MAG: MFS transporter [Rickettsiaceae bacterium]